MGARNSRHRDQSALYFRMEELGRGKKCVSDSALAGEPEKVISNTSDHDQDFRDWISHGMGTKDKMDKHKACTEAVAIIVQYDFDNGHPPFEVDGTILS